MQKVKGCQKCKRNFLPSHGNARFCSDTCRQEFYKDYKNGWRKENEKVENDYKAGGHRAYNNIIQRTTNVNNTAYPMYGGRGIRCTISREEFLSIYFSTDTCEDCGCKLNDADRRKGDGRTLERIDPAKNYEKGNLRILCRKCNSRRARVKRQDIFGNK